MAKQVRGLFGTLFPDSHFANQLPDKPAPAQSPNDIVARGPNYVQYRSGRMVFFGSSSNPHKLSNTSRSVKEQQIPLAAEGTPIPFVYGRKIVGGRLLWAGLNASQQLVVHVAWCFGPIDAIEEIRIGDKTDPDFVTATHYTGTTGQGVDPTLAAVIPGFDNDMVLSFRGESIGIAHSVLVFDNASAGILPAAVIRGLKVYDPRDGFQQLINPATWTYSDNPSLCAANFHANKVYGRGGSVDWDSVMSAADANDELVGANKRRTLAVVYDQRVQADQVMSDLGAYAGAFLVMRGDTLRLVPDRPTIATRTLPASKIQDLRLRERKLSNAPTVVTVRYTEEDEDGNWREGLATAKASGVDAGTTPWREMNIARPGISSHFVAYREALEQLNRGTVLTFEGDLITQDEGLLDEVGDAVNITHPRGLSNQPVRLTEVHQAGTGRWLLRFEQYAVAVYSNVVQAGPARISSSLPDPTSVPAISNLTAQSGTGHLMQMQDGTVAPTVLLQWDAVSTPYDFLYAVWYKKTADSQWSAMSIADNAARLGPLEDGTEYTFRVRVRHLAGYWGDWTTITHTVAGKTAPPADVTGLTLNDTVLSWDEVSDLDLKGYKVRYRQGTGTEWAGAIPVFEGFTTADRVDISHIEQTGESVTFIVVAKDTSGNISATPATLNVDLRPGAISNFAIDNKILSWDELADFDLKGYKLRYHQGNDTDWATATPLHEGVLTRTRLDVSHIQQSGASVTFLIKAKTVGKNFTAAPATLNVDLRPTDVPWAFITGSVITFGEVDDMDLKGYVVRYSISRLD